MGDHRIIQPGKRAYRVNRSAPVVIRSDGIGSKKEKIELPAITGLNVKGDRKLKILLPPGMGDIHWALLRLRGILRHAGYKGPPPSIHVCSGDPAFDRSMDFVKMIPWIEWGGYFDIRPKAIHAQAHEAFFNGKIFTDWNGFDLFLCVNKFIEQGWKIDDILPEAGPADWEYPINLPAPTLYEPTILATFYRASFYGEWWKKAHPSKYLAALGRALDDRSLPHKITIVGAKWDESVARELQSSHKRVVNMAGKTSMQQLFAMKRSADAFLGHPSGSGMMAQHIGCSTVLLWGKWWQFTDGMRTNWAHPDMLSAGRYRAMSVEDDPDGIARSLIEAARL